MIRFLVFLFALFAVAMLTVSASAGHVPACDDKCIVPATVTVPACDAVSEHATQHKVHARAHRPLLRVVAAPLRLIARTFQTVRTVRHNAIERRQARRAHRRVSGPLHWCR